MGMLAYAAEGLGRLDGGLDEGLARFRLLPGLGLQAADGLTVLRPVGTDAATGAALEAFTALGANHDQGLCGVCRHAIHLQ